VIKIDSQVTEIIGRNYLIAQILGSGLEVATPMRDRGVDLLVYRDIPRRNTAFQCLPVQLKSATVESFAVSKKYDKFPKLLIVHIWNVGNASEGHPTFAMTYEQTLDIAAKMGWTNTATWRANEIYSTTRPSTKLKDLLEEHRMNPGRWQTVFDTFGSCG